MSMLSDDALAARERDETVENSVYEDEVLAEANLTRAEFSNAAGSTAVILAAPAFTTARLSSAT